MAFSFTYALNTAKDGLVITGYTGAVPSKLVIPNIENFIDEGVSRQYPVVDMSNGVFTNVTAIQEIVIGSNIQRISQNAFSGTSITDIIIPDNVKTIAKGAFYNCTLLRGAVIGKGVTLIAALAFASCTNLTKVFLLSPTPPELRDNSGFNNISNLAHLYCLPEYVDTYKSAWSGWTYSQYRITGENVNLALSFYYNSLATKKYLKEYLDSHIQGYLDSYIEANPDDIPEEHLSTLKIGNILYSVNNTETYYHKVEIFNDNADEYYMTLYFMNSKHTPMTINDVVDVQNGFIGGFTELLNSSDVIYQILSVSNNGSSLTHPIKIWYVMNDSNMSTAVIPYDEANWTITDTVEYI